MGALFGVVPGITPTAAIAFAGLAEVRIWEEPWGKDAPSAAVMGDKLTNEL